jgi:hypothetical protein
MRAGRPKAELVVSSEERVTLEQWARRRSSAQALALRAGIVLDCASGMTNTAVARRRVSKQMVGKWRERFVRHRAGGRARYMRDMTAASEIFSARLISLVDHPCAIRIRIGSRRCGRRRRSARKVLS